MFVSCTTLAASLNYLTELESLGHCYTSSIFHSAQNIGKSGLISRSELKWASHVTASRKWCDMLLLILMCAGPAKVGYYWSRHKVQRLRLVRGTTGFKSLSSTLSSDIHRLVKSEDHSKYLEHGIFHSMIGKQRFVWWMNFEILFVVYSLAPWGATRKLFQQMESFLIFFVTSPAEKVWGHHDLPFVLFGIQRKIFHPFTHSFNNYWVSQKTVHTL